MLIGVYEVEEYAIEKVEANVQRGTLTTLLKGINRPYARGLVTHTLDGYQETEGNTQLRTFQNHFFMHLNLVSTEPSHVYNSLVMNHFVFGKATKADKEIDETGPS